MHSGKRGPAAFTIDIKISGQRISIPIYEGQNHQELIKRFCQQHVFKSDYQQAIKDKIIQSLLSMLKKAELSAQLKKKVTNFLNNDDKKAHIKQKSQKSQKSFRQNSDVSTPFKMLAQLNNPASSHRKSISNRHTGAHQDVPKQKSLKQIEVKKPNFQQACIRKNKFQTSHINNNSKSRMANSKGADSDLIAAYEVIYKKSKQPQMKVMAKQFLQSCGALKNQKTNRTSNKKISNFNNCEKSSSKNEINANFEQNGQAKHNNSLIYSLAKFEAVDQTHQTFQRSRSPPQIKNTPIKNSPKRQRIKYDLGEDLSNLDIQKYDTEGLNYSRYEAQLGRSSYRPRASLSYQRLPYFQPESEYQDRSIRNSRNINAYGQPERAISLRRTRKYKYL